MVFGNELISFTLTAMEKNDSYVYMSVYVYVYRYMCIDICFIKSTTVFQFYPSCLQIFRIFTLVLCKYFGTTNFPNPYSTFPGLRSLISSKLYKFSIYVTYIEVEDLADFPATYLDCQASVTSHVLIYFVVVKYVLT